MIVKNVKFERLINYRISEGC